MTTFKKEKRRVKSKDRQQAKGAPQQRPDDRAGQPAQANPAGSAEGMPPYAGHGTYAAHASGAPPQPGGGYPREWGQPGPSHFEPSRAGWNHGSPSPEWRPQDPPARQARSFQSVTIFKRFRKQGWLPVDGFSALEYDQIVGRGHLALLIVDSWGPGEYQLHFATVHGTPFKVWTLRLGGSSPPTGAISYHDDRDCEDPASGLRHLALKVYDRWAHRVNVRDRLTILTQLCARLEEHEGLLDTFNQGRQREIAEDVLRDLVCETRRADAERHPRGVAPRSSSELEAASPQRSKERRKQRRNLVQESGRPASDPSESMEKRRLSSFDLIADSRCSRSSSEQSNSNGPAAPLDFLYAVDEFGRRRPSA